MHQQCHRHKHIPTPLRYVTVSELCKLSFFKMRRLLLLLVCLLSGTTAAFSPSPRLGHKAQPVPTELLQFKHPFDERSSVVAATTRSTTVAIAGLVTVVSALVPAIAMAETADLEYADLPPPYIPAVFGLGLLVVRSYVHKKRTGLQLN
jgi:hypothetical protein